MHALKQLQYDTFILLKKIPLELKMSSLQPRSTTELLDIASLRAQYAMETSTAVADVEDYNPFDLERLQLYNPVYSTLFSGTFLNSGLDKVTLDHAYEVVDMDHVRPCCTKTSSTAVDHHREIHFKFSPLLDPYAYMIGKYAQDESPETSLTALPQPYATANRVHPKIADPCNAAYVDCFFNSLSNMLLEKHGFVNGISYYGSYLGIQRKFKLNVTDDLEHLRGSRYFLENLGKRFSVPGHHESLQSESGLNAIGGSRRNKKKIDVVEDALLDDVLCLDGEDIVQDAAAAADALESIYSKEESSSAPHPPTTEDSDSDSELNYSSESEEDDPDEDEEDDNFETLNNEEDEEWTDDDGDEYSDEAGEETEGFIYNFPCQMICMEKCDGTLDQLFADGDMDLDQGASALLQVIFTLIAYQRAFGFTHNDLHTNNIMYVNTDREYLFYRYNAQIYRVPTHGRIYKIIDFGRSIYTYQGHLFCSDSFFPKGDAATQYNFGPFLNPAKPVLEPNPSFDLCRLGVSLFDFVMDLDTEVSDMDAFQRTIRRWCQDDRKHNVLYKRNGDDRYPNFKLYKMIARTVHRHTPEAQLEFALFRRYVTTDGVDNEVVMDLDALPSYQAK